MEVEVKKISVAEFQEMEFDENDSHLYERINGELKSAVLADLSINPKTLFS